MRKVRVTADQYYVFLYPQFAASVAENADEFETQLRVIRKLKDQTLSQDEPVTEQDRQEADRKHTVPVPYRRLLEAEAVFLFEEDEWRLLCRRIENYKKMVAAGAAELFAQHLQTRERGIPVARIWRSFIEVAGKTIGRLGRLGPSLPSQSGIP